MTLAVVAWVDRQRPDPYLARLIQRGRGRPQRSWNIFSSVSRLPGFAVCARRPARGELLARPCLRDDVVFHHAATLAAADSGLLRFPPHGLGRRHSGNRPPCASGARSMDPRLGCAHSTDRDQHLGDARCRGSDRRRRAHLRRDPRALWSVRTPPRKLVAVALALSPATFMSASGLPRGQAASKRCYRQRIRTIAGPQPAAASCQTVSSVAPLASLPAWPG